MPRLPRLVLPNVPLHLIQRGNNRTAIFFADDDYAYLHDTLLQASRRHGCAIHAYVFMTNHVHLLVTPGDIQGVARLMQAAGRRYVRYINDRYRRTGTLWEGRYKSTLIDSERYLLACARYIELNPVRAIMVENPAGYRWSSYPANALGRIDELVTPHPLYRALGASAAARYAAYRELFSAHLDPDTLKAIRTATCTGTVLGNERFRDEIEAAIKRRVHRHAHGGDRRSESFQENRKP